jgi:hypothetical protein
VYHLLLSAFLKEIYLENMFFSFFHQTGYVNRFSIEKKMKVERLCIARENQALISERERD